MKLFSSFFALAIMVTLGVSDFAFAQDNQKAKQQEKNKPTLATVRGKIVQARQNKLKFDVQKLKVRMSEQVQLTPFPFPQDWQSRSIESRQKWMKEFLASDAGKQLVAKRQKQFDARKQFDVDIEDDGSFVIFDVAPGRYGMAGRLDQEIDGKNYAFEVFGQIDIGKVNEVQLKDLPIVVTRLFRIGEMAPKFEIKKISGDGKISRKDFDGKYLLISFWSAQSQPCVRDFKSLVPIYKSLKTISGEIEFLSICLDQDRKPATKVLKDSNATWSQGAVEGWGAETAEAFGVRSIPSYWLVDKSGKIIVTNAVFFRLFRQGVGIQKVITDAIAGKDLMKMVEEAEKKAQAVSGK